MDNCINLTLRKASRALTKYFNKELILRKYPLKITQLHLLYMIKKCSDDNVGEVSEKLIMDRTTMTRNSDCLIEDDYIKNKSRSGDKRNRVLELTVKGEKALEQGLIEVDLITNKLSVILKKRGIDAKQMREWLKYIGEDFYEKCIEIEKSKTN